MPRPGSSSTRRAAGSRPRRAAQVANSSVQTGDVWLEFNIDSETRSLYGVTPITPALKNQRSNFKSTVDLKTKFPLKIHL